jgi:hypothetical protein
MLTVVRHCVFPTALHNYRKVHFVAETYDFWSHAYLVLQHTIRSLTVPVATIHT